MSIVNGYATLTDFKRRITPPGQTLSTDTADDDTIEEIIEVASRRVDDLTGRAFYPYVATRHYDIPADDTLWLDNDLLALTTFTNGDDTAIASTEYILYPADNYPKYSLQMRGTSSVIWEVDSNTSGQQVIDVLGFWGYHKDYATRAWKSAGTLGAAIANTSILTATMTAGHTLEAAGGQILKIDSELFNSESVAANTLTVQARGDNGSTAATHLINTAVYVWQPMKDIKALTLEIALIMYRARYGENVDVVSTYTPAGVIVTPRSLPVWAQEIIRTYQRLA